MRLWEIFSLFLLASAAFCGEPTYLTCRRGNPFRQYIENHFDVPILAKPSMTSSLCGDEWATFGNCCNEAKLVAAAENDRAKISKSAMAVSQEFGKFISVFKPFYDNLKLLSLADESAWSEVGVRKAIKLARVLVVNETQVKIFDTLSDYSHPHSAKNYKKMTVGCWNYIWKLRASSHCSTCSARGFEFFKGVKAISTDTACVPVIDKCYKSIKVTLRMLRVWRYLMSNYNGKALADLQLIFNGVKKLQNFNDLMFNVNDGGVARDIESITFNFQNMMQKDFKHKGRFCDKFVKLVQTPLIVSIANCIDTSHPWVLDFKPAIKAVIESVMAEKMALLALIKEKIKEKRAELRGDDEPDDIDTLVDDEEQDSRALGRSLVDMTELGPESMFDSDAIWPSEDKEFKIIFDDRVTNEHCRRSAMNLTLRLP